MQLVLWPAAVLMVTCPSCCLKWLQAAGYELQFDLVVAGRWGCWRRETPRLSQSWASPASAKPVSRTMDGGSLQELLLFRPCPGLFLLGHIQPQLALMRQGRDGALKSTGDEPAARFNAHSVFGGERHSLAQRSVFNHRANGKKKPPTRQTQVFSHQCVLCYSQMDLVMWLS